MRTNTENQRVNDDEIDLRLLFGSIRKKWHYFIFSFIIFVIGAFLYTRFTLPVFEATSSVLIKDSKNTSKNIEDILTGDVLGNTKNIATEIGILRSRSVLEETINELNLGVSYFDKSSIFSYPVYKNAPFSVTYTRVNDGIYDEEFHLTPIDENTFHLELDADNRTFHYSYSGNHNYGAEIRDPNFTITVAKNEMTFDKSRSGEYAFVINSMNKLLTYYNEKMKIEPINKDATIVTISVQDKIKDRAVDFLNTLGKVYINRDIKDKSSVAALTLKFVDEQLEEISKTLNATELDLQKFKEEKGTVNLSEESKAYLERVTAVDETRIKAEIDLKSLDYLYNYITSNLDLESLAPSTLGNPDPTLVELIAKLKELQNKRKSLSYGSSAASPALKVIDEQIDQTKKSLVESINNLRNLTRNSLKGINGQISDYENSIRKIPNIERELLAIQRNFTVNENIYVYLLQKKAETGIAKATAVSDNKVLDVATVNDIPVIPNRKTVAIITLMLILIVPLLIVLIQGYIRNTISNREDIEKLTKTPIIGVVGHHNSGERLVVSTKPKSSIAEAFRSIRANLMFFGLSDEHKIVLITSSVGGEGKSFSTLNLAAVLSLQSHKVVIVGMDLRKPQLVQDLGVSNDIGVSTYLIGKSTLASVICKTNVPGLDIIPAGPVPPNPAELLAKKETVNLMNELRTMYDYIIIDTPPVGIVSDAMMLMNLADINIFILRENYSKKEYIKTINTYYTAGKVKNLCILLNDAGNHQRYGYGYGYGSGYGYHGYGYYDEDSKPKGALSKLLKRK
ncbi:MAG: polysaccharide biosynthesis tyrosine autokinase [Bacteroidetes bacterium]|nr:polysaccharide biosynthesis tyrosine autokinase [Bacteroidota bacterium]